MSQNLFFFGPKFSTGGQIWSLYAVLAAYMDFAMIGMETRMNFWHFGSNFMKFAFQDLSHRSIKDLISK